MDMVFYPTKAGIKTEIVLKEKTEGGSFEFSLRTSLSWFENLQNGYILFKNGGEKESLVYQPLVQYTTEEGQQLDVTTQMKIEKEEGGYHVEMILNEDILEKAAYPVKLDPSFELYLNKMPDTSVYSKCDVNSYLRHYAVVGEHPVLGEGWEYVRSRFRYFSRSLKPSNVISSAYHTYVLFGNNSDDNTTLYELDTQWSSTNLIWSEKVAYGNAISDGEFRNRKLKFDITEFTKECLKDPELGKESRGFLLKSDAVKIIATSDNSEMVPFFRIDMKKLPKDFIGNESINLPIAGYDVVY